MLQLTVDITGTHKTDDYCNNTYLGNAGQVS